VLRPDAATVVLVERNRRIKVQEELADAVPRQPAYEDTHRELQRLLAAARRVEDRLRAGLLSHPSAMAQLRNIRSTDDAGVTWLYLPLAGALVLHRMDYGGVPIPGAARDFTDQPVPEFAAWRGVSHGLHRASRLPLAAALAFAVFVSVVLAIVVGPTRASSGMAVIHEDPSTCSTSALFVGGCPR
jgi:hypothetical protein